MPVTSGTGEPRLLARVICKAIILFAFVVSGCLQVIGGSDYKIGASGGAGGSVTGGSGGIYRAGGSGGGTGGTTGGGGIGGTTGTSCNPPVGRACSLLERCGCSASQNCVVAMDSTDGVTQCVTAGSKPADTLCTSNTDCAKGSMCHWGVCHAFCDVASDCGSTAFTCEALTFVDDADVTQDVPDVKLCTRSCKPTFVGACPSGQGCYAYQTSSGSWSAQCLAAGASTATNGCASNWYSCAAGYTCFNSRDCRSYCSVSSPSCPTGQACRPHTYPVSVGGVEYGRCATNCTLPTSATCPAGEKCFPVVNVSETDATIGYTDCIATGAGAVGAACTKTTECGSALGCWWRSCHKLCRTGTTDCPAGQVCEPMNPGVQVDGAEWGQCTKTCDPLVPTSVCGVAGNCHVYVTAGQTYTDCVPAGTKTELSPCSSIYDCAAGLFCGSFSKLCLRQCRLNQAADCTGGTCSGFTDQPTSGGFEYGFCNQTCNLVSPSAVCGTGKGCASFTDVNGVVQTECVQAASTNPTTCASDTDCKPGFYCSAAFECMQWCRVGYSTECPSGTTCIAHSTPNIVRGVEYGHCG
jgi:hypothetical protein